MNIKPNTIIRYTEAAFRVLGKVKNDTLLDENGEKICCLKDYGLVGYKCENLDTKELVIVPISKKKEREIVKGQKHNGDKAKQYILW